MKVTRKEIDGLHNIWLMMSQLAYRGVKWSPGAKETLQELYLRLRVASWYGLKSKIDFNFANEDIENLWYLFLDLGEITVGDSKVHKKIVESIL